MSTCGTYAAYQRHRRRGEAACPACRDAFAAYMRDYRHRTGRSTGCIIPDNLLVRLADLAEPFDPAAARKARDILNGGAA